MDSFSMLTSPFDNSSDNSDPMYNRLIIRIKKMIGSGVLQPNMKLPSSRTLSKELSIARNTVIQAYEQLQVEGYIYSNKKGSFVTSAFPISKKHNQNLSTEITLSERGVKLSTFKKIKKLGKFSPGTPAITTFPLNEWRNALKKTYINQNDLLKYGEAGGELDLKKTICEHVAISRGIGCKPEQIFIVGSMLEALRALFIVLTNPGDVIWTEEPGYSMARAVMYISSLRIIPIEVDSQGLNPWAVNSTIPSPKIIYTTPSYQYPTGVTMTVKRRKMLIDYSIRNSSIIIEDNYGGEMNYDKNEIPSLFGLQGTPPVIFAESFSKTLFPSMRVSFFILPENLVNILAPSLEILLNNGPSRHVQHALSYFIRSGSYSRYLRKMRGIYKKRRDLLVTELSQLDKNLYKTNINKNGLYLLLEIPSTLDDVSIVAKLNSYGFFPAALSSYYYMEPARKGIVIGFGNESEIEVKRFTKVLILTLEKSMC